MNCNLWNIKEMFSIPPGTGTSRSSGRNSAPSDYSSLTDSQLLFGSQMCPDMSQSASLETNVQFRQQRNSQQNSQDSDASIFNKYQSKPYLYSGDLKDKGTLHFGAGKSKGILEQFEEDKKKAREKNESEVLNSLFFHIQENIQELRTAFVKFDEQANSREKTAIDQYEHISKALEDNSEHYASILKALNAKTTTEQVLLGTEQQLLSVVSPLRVILPCVEKIRNDCLGKEKRKCSDAQKNTEIVDLKSSFQILKEQIEVLKTEQREQHLKLTDRLKLMPDQLQYANILSELQKLKPIPRSPVHLIDSTSQTSPTLIQDLCLVSEKKTFLTTTKVCQRGSLQSQPYMALSPSKHGRCAKSGTPTPVLYSSDLKTTTMIQFDPSNMHLNSNKNMNENASLESTLSSNQQHSNYNHNGQFSNDVSERQCLLSQDNTQSATKNIVSRRTKQKKAVSTLQQHVCELRPRPSREQQHQTVNTDNFNHVKSVTSNTSIEDKPKNVKPKKSCKKKVIVRKSKTGYSERKTKLINSKCTPDNLQRQLACEPSATLVDFSRRDFKKNASTVNSNLYNPSSFSAKQETIHESKHMKQEKAISVGCQRKLAQLPKSKTKKISATPRGSTPGKVRQPFQWDISSQETSHFYCNVNSGNQMNWHSPSSPFMYNPSCSVVAKKNSKSAFESIFFDSSDDSG